MRTIGEEIIKRKLSPNFAPMTCRRQLRRNYRLYEYYIGHEKWKGCRFAKIHLNSRIAALGSQRFILLYRRIRKAGISLTPILKIPLLIEFHGVVEKLAKKFRNYTVIKASRIMVME